LSSQEQSPTAKYLTPGEHGISRDLVDAAAMSVVEGLHEAGFDALLVGGCVRDLLLGIVPKDFDVATNATPEDVKATFRRARLVGRRFRIAHVRFGREVIEVSTFRRNAHDDDDEPFEGSRKELHGRDTARSAEGMILRDNVYGTIDEDAFRRDFTVNALYYDPIDETLIDYVDGLEDIRSRQLHLIGNPAIRFREDPVRILRAVRFAAKLSFNIEPDTENAISGAAHLLADVPPARLFDEICKLFLYGGAAVAWGLIEDLELADVLFPDRGNAPHIEELIHLAMQNTDARVEEGKPVTPGFLLAVLLWNTYLEELSRLREQMALADARPAAATDAIRLQSDLISIPRRFSQFVREVWLLQPRLEAQMHRGIDALMGHPRFRAAYDFLLLRAQVGDADKALAEWWTDYQEADPEGRATMRQKLAPSGKRRRRRRKKPRPENGNTSQQP
jgi:poly(A) polymerase